MDNVLRRVSSLSIHADYRCRHSGVCCSSNWDVPVEVPIYRSLQAALDGGTLRLAPESAGLPPFAVGPGLPDDTGAVFERNDDGRCVFFDGGSRLCVVHRDLGESALPETCKHFPRIAIDDGRGLAIALSHYCPTAAEMLFREDVELGVVDAPEAFPDRDYDGLTVTGDDVPPLLRPGVVMDVDGYDAWERHMVRRCADAANAETAVATLFRDAALVRQWRPDGLSMSMLVSELPGGLVPADSPADLGASLLAYRQALLAVPEEWRPHEEADGLERAYQAFVLGPWPEWSRPLRRYAAAKAFASWTAYQGRGLLSIVTGLDAALALVRVEAARQCRDAGRALDKPLLLAAFQQADFLLNHLAVGEDLAAAWAKAEER